MSFSLLNAKRRTVRSIPNPNDKTTIISIYPQPIDEVKHTIYPGFFHIDPGTMDKPAILVVGSSNWWAETHPDQPMLEITHSSVQVADSIINDYSNSLLAYNASEAMPGLFFVPGEKTVIDVQIQYPQEFEKAAARQKNWFSALVKMADALWARSNGNPLAISDQMRMAAQELQMKDKAWLADFNTLKLENCPACGVLRDNKYPICQYCKTVTDPVKFKELGLKFAS